MPYEIKIISDRDPSLVEHDVNESMKEGWKPWDAAVTYQSRYKDDPEPKVPVYVVFLKKHRWGR